MSVFPQRVSPPQEVGLSLRGSALRFRGPLGGGEASPGPLAQGARGSVLFIGGSETFGGYVARPFVQRFAHQSGLETGNLGAFCAGWEALGRDPVVLKYARTAGLIVLQLMGPQYRTNPYFQVHPRRNDRFVAPYAPLRQLFPQVDFTRFSFVGHLMRSLQQQDVYAHRRLQRGLQQAWRQHIAGLARLYRTPFVFLWVDHGMDPGLGEAVAGLTQHRLAELDLTDVPLLQVQPDLLGQRPMFIRPEGQITVISGAYHQKVADALAQWLPSVLADVRLN
ncbi:DUF6473 family protein [Phaeobacter sp. CNT1-3]|nr:DUF6473 family protein [Phaeobacter sp. CNT1-3]